MNKKIPLFFIRRMSSPEPWKIILYSMECNKTDFLPRIILQIDNSEYIFHKESSRAVGENLHQRNTWPTIYSLMVWGTSEIQNQQHARSFTSELSQVLLFKCRFTHSYKWKSQIISTSICWPIMCEFSILCQARAWCIYLTLSLWSAPVFWYLGPLPIPWGSPWALLIKGDHELKNYIPTTLEFESVASD